MNSNAQDYDSISAFIREGESFTLLSHISPDGDTLGSALALTHLLDKLGKTVEIVCSNPVPKIYSYMPGSDRVKMPEDAVGYSSVISVDCADVALLRKGDPPFRAGGEDRFDRPPYHQSRLCGHQPR